MGGLFYGENINGQECGYRVGWDMATGVRVAYATVDPCRDFGSGRVGHVIANLCQERGV